MSTADELACVYAALILHDEGVEVTSSKIATVTKAAGITVEPFYPTLFAKFLESRPLGGLLTNVGSAPAGGEAAPAAAAGGDAAPAEEKKAAPKVESEEDEDMGFGLFD